MSPAQRAASVGPDSLPAQLARLQALRSQPDPTLRIETTAAVPKTPSSPKKKLSLIAGVLAGLILGTGSAFALQVLDPRLRREEQLRGLYSLPILGRIPRDTRRGDDRALAPERLSPSTLEAYRTLRAILAASRGRLEERNCPAKVTEAGLRVSFHRRQSSQRPVETDTRIRIEGRATFGSEIGQ